MLKKIIKLETRNYEEILRIINDTQEDLRSVLVDLIIYIPSRIILVKKLLQEINENIKYNVLTELSVRLKNSNVNDFISIIRALYVFSNGLFDIEVNIKDNGLINIIKNCSKIKKEFNTDDEIKNNIIDEYIFINNKDKRIENVIENINNTLKNLDESFIEELNANIKIFKAYGNDGDIFIAKQLIENFQFDRNECVNQLIKYFQPEDYKNLCKGIFLSEENNKRDFFYVSLILVMAKSYGFLKVLYSLINEVEEGFKDKILAFIYEQYYSPAYNIKLEVQVDLYNPEMAEDEIKIFKTLVTPSTLKEMEKYSCKKALNLFFNDKIEEEEPIVNEGYIDIRKMEIEELLKMDRILFFSSFCFYCSDSITHFLTYLEYFKKCFILNEDEQRMFLDVFKKFFIHKRSFKKFLSQKMLRFKMINERVAEEYPEIFINQ